MTRIGTFGISAGLVAAAFALAPTQAGAVALVQHGSAAYTQGSWSDIDVNPNTDFVYIGNGFGANGVQGFDFSNPNAPTVVGTTAGAGTGVAVNPSNNRFYTIDGTFGGKMREWNGTTLGLTQSSVNGQTGCGGAMALNHSTGIAYGSTQCVDSLHRYDPTTDTITNTVGLGMVGSDIALNEFTNRVYAADGSGGNLTKVYDGTNLSSLGTVAARVHEANEVTNRLYAGSGANLLVLDGTTNAVLDTLVGENSGYVAVDSVNDWFFTYQGTTLKMWDGLTDSLLASLTVGGATSLQMLATGGDGWVYGLTCDNAGCSSRSVRAFEVTGATAPEPATFALFGLGLAAVGAIRRRRRTIRG